MVHGIFPAITISDTSFGRSLLNKFHLNYIVNKMNLLYSEISGRKNSEQIVYFFIVDYVGSFLAESDNLAALKIV